MRLLPRVAVSLLLAGCAAPVDTRQLSPGRAGLALEVVDAPTQQAKEINVTIERVTAHSNVDGWVEIFNQGPVTVDLLTLKSRVMNLGFRNLPAGKVSQIRLYLKEGGTQNVVLPSGEIAQLKVPSGVQSGIKIKGPFTLDTCGVTTVQLDFDGHKSIWYHPTGNGGDWILRPVIHTRRAHTQPVTCDGPVPGGGGGTILETPGESCSVGSDCLSGVCLNRLCQGGAQGTPCNVDRSCVSGVCDTDGSCTAPVVPAPSDPGSQCRVGAECSSGICAAGACSPGLQGQPCNGQVGCEEGFSCEAGACAPLLN